MPRIRSFLATDVDVQRTTPLTLVRQAVPYPTHALQVLGVPAVERDRFSQECFPDDVYGLAPAKLTALGDECAERGIVWGAAKAFEHRRRHGGSGGHSGHA